MTKNIVMGSVLLTGIVFGGIAFTSQRETMRSVRTDSWPRGGVMSQGTVTVTETHVLGTGEVSRRQSGSGGE